MTAFCLPRGPIPDGNTAFKFTKTPQIKAGRQRCALSLSASACATYRSLPSSHSHTHPPTHPLAHSLTRSLTHSLLSTYFSSLPRSLTHSPEAISFSLSKHIEAAPAVWLCACQYACLCTSLAGCHSVCGNCARAPMCMSMHTWAWAYACAWAWAWAWAWACVHTRKDVEAVEVQQYGCFVAPLTSGCRC